MLTDIEINFLGVFEMSLTDYFETVEGTGILATADSEGNVDLAIYARPHPNQMRI